MILVTGASGLLGTSLLSRAQQTSRKVAGISRTNEVRVSGIRVQPLELTDPSATRQFILELHPSTIIHCAAATDVDWCEDHPDEAHEINTTASEYLASLAQEIRACFVQVSTDSVFDGEKGNYSETDVPRPLNEYAKTKLSAERAVLAVHSSPLIVRVNFYGSGELKKRKLAAWVLHQLRAGRRVQGFTDVFFCPMFASDLADTIFDLLDAKLTGLHHVVGSERISKYEFAVRLATTFEFDPELVVPSVLRNAALRAERPRDLSLNSAKVSAALSRKMPDVDSGLQKFLTFSKPRYGKPDAELCSKGGK
jgi:dTDP-4-dehydrorhamnose reductase